ncbi:MAG: hypothetical protein ACXQTP_07075 [Candidatus Methanofastidiosia archaeon]
MDDKNKLGLMFTLVGGVAGVISAFGTKTVPTPLLLLVAVVVYYGSSYITHFIGVDMMLYGGRRKVLQTGFFSFLQGWLVVWFFVYEAANLYSNLALSLL